MPPLVSVLTPSFNQARWLRDNLASVAAQTYQPIEHVVMDGGSTDGTVDVLEASENVNWRSEPDHGQSHALNKALAASSGEIIGWLNSDDAYFSPQAIRDVVSLFDSEPDVDVVYGHALLVDSAGNILKMIWVPPFSYRLLLLYNYLVQPSVFFRRSAIEDRFVDEAFDYSMDRELWLRLGRKGRFKRLPQILAIDRHQLERKTSARPDLVQADRRRLLDMYAASRLVAGDPRLKPLTLGFRLLGLRLAGQASSPAAYAAPNARRGTLIRRQLAARAP
jgi:glycosyltransferase involved in cell wall biosynthesis